MFEHTRYDIAASSTLSSQGEHSYEAENVATWDDELVWAEGVDGNGVGESLSLTMKTALPIHHLFVKPGTRDLSGFGVRTVEYPNSK